MIALVAGCSGNGSHVDALVDLATPDLPEIRLDQTVPWDQPRDQPVADLTGADAFNGTWKVSTVAGTGVQGFQDGPAASAQFNSPSGIAVDGTGKVYVADTFNHRIRVISGGQVTTLAGTGTAGFAEGVAATAQLNYPEGVAVDGAGKVYVADASNYRIRVISSGQVTTLAGSGTKGFADGPASSAQFDFVYAVAVDSVGKVYVVDMTQHRIRMIWSGQVSTLAGSTKGFADGPALSAQLNLPTGVASDSAGKVYIGDGDNERIRVVSGGQVSTLAGSGLKGFADGPAFSAQFSYPHGLEPLGNGDVVVADTTNSRIRLISSGQVSTLAGTGTKGLVDGPADQARFETPCDVAVGSAGKIYVADSGNNCIRLIEPQ